MGRPDWILRDADETLGRRHRVDRLEPWLPAVTAGLVSAGGRGRLARRQGVAVLRGGTGPARRTPGTARKWPLPTLRRRLRPPGEATTGPGCRDGQQASRPVIERRGSASRLRTVAWCA